MSAPWLGLRDDLPVARDGFQVVMARSATSAWMLGSLGLLVAASFLLWLSLDMLVELAPTWAWCSLVATFIAVQRWRAWKGEAHDRAIATYARGDYAVARRQLMRVLQRGEGSTRVVALPYLISTLWHTGDLDGALREVERLDELCQAQYGEGTEEFVATTRWRAAATRILLHLEAGRVDVAAEHALRLAPPRDAVL